jgi:hypothetical protein
LGGFEDQGRRLRGISGADESNDGRLARSETMVEVGNPEFHAYFRVGMNQNEIHRTGMRIPRTVDQSG